MNILQLNKKTLLLLCALAFLALLFLLIGFLQLRETGSPQQDNSLTTPIPTPLITKRDLVTATIDPTPETILVSGEKQTFVITFSQPQNRQLLSPVLTVKDVTNDDDPQSLPIKSLFDNTTTLRITSPLPTQPNSIYLLTIVNTQTHAIIFEASYTSSPPIPTPVAKNNTALSQFLPYTTTTYSLEYDKNSNLYVFHFLYNAGSSDDVQTQFEKAQAAAKVFITSKNIDLDSLVIQWKRY